MFMVVTLHVLGQGGVLAAQAPFTWGWTLCWTLETACFCAVNCFGIISGYVSRSETLSLKGCVLRWAQVVFYSLSLTVLLGLVFPGTVGYRDILGAFFPVITQKYWYFTAYFALMFFTPFLNQLLNGLKPKRADQLMTTIFLLLCLLPSLTGRDLFHLRSGYTFLWLCALYLLGGCLRQRRSQHPMSPILLLVGYLLCVLVTAGSKALSVFLQGHLQVSLRPLDALFAYTSPTILCAAIFLLLLFRSIPIRGRIAVRWITFASPLSFGVYLIHTHPSVWNGLLSSRFQAFVHFSPFVCVILVLLTAMAIFIGGILVDYFRNFLFRIVRKA